LKELTGGSPFLYFHYTLSPPPVNTFMARLNAFALKRQYGDIASARPAALSTEYAADGQAANAAYDATRTAAIALAPDVRAGTLTPEQALAQLPAPAWP
jgi:hypothetical protein